MEYKIKVKKDTPIHSKGASLTIDDFRASYPSLIHKDNSNNFVVNVFTVAIKQEDLGFPTNLIDWFELIITHDKFKLGDWVWHEGLRAAFLIKSFFIGREWLPNYATPEAVNQNPNTYKRLATKEEIEFYMLTPFLNNNLLVGQYKCYYYRNVWKEIDITHIIKMFVAKNREINDTCNIYIEGERMFTTTLLGLKVGCVEVPYDIIVQIAKLLKIIV